METRRKKKQWDYFFGYLSIMNKCSNADALKTLPITSTILFQGLFSEMKKFETSKMAIFSIMFFPRLMVVFYN